MLKNLRNKLKDNKGFSLVELIVVIAIMVILIALLVPQVSGYIAKANTTANKAAAKSAYTEAVNAVADTLADGQKPEEGTIATAVQANIPNFSSKFSGVTIKIEDNKVVSATVTTQGGETFTYPECC